MSNITVDIKSSIAYSAYVKANFDKGKEVLEQEDYRIISLRENAQLRMQEGKDAFVSRKGNWVREGVIYVPKRGVFLTRNSPIMANAQEATDCHRNEQEFYLTNHQIEESLVDSVELSDKPIQTNRFAEDPITVYAFGDIAEQYGQFLENAGIKEMPVSLLVTIEGRLFAKQMRFLRLIVGSKSSLRDYGCLSCNYYVRGIRQGD
ncbi:hypothetical protein HY500_01635 [Candidatus Woesearchaeota archaeon]|nr:hypothetical protein [Candidatus Woesearchaeota archaeon]